MIPVGLVLSANVLELLFQEMEDLIPNLENLKLIFKGPFEKPQGYGKHKESLKISRP